jgi:phage terminase large subunit-like protein
VSLSALASAAHVLQRRATDDPLAYFRPTPPQLEFLRCTDRVRLYRGANQVGKTWVGMADAIWRCLGEHPYQRVRPGPIECHVVTVTSQQGIAIQEKCWALLPKQAIAEDTEWVPGKGFRGRQPMVVFKNGSIIKFRSVQQGALSMAGSTLDHLVVDEPPDETLWNELVPRVFRKQGTISLTMTPVGLPLGWLKKLVEEKRVTDICAPLTVENTTPIGGRPLLTQERIDELAAHILESERGQRLFGEWETTFVTGRVFPMFDPKLHVRDEAPAGDWLIGVGIDHGKESGAQVAILSAIRTNADGHHMIRVLDQVQSDGMTTPEQDARAIMDMLKRCGLRWEEVDRWIGDRAAISRRGGAIKSNAMLVQAIERDLRLPTGSWPARIHTAYKPKGSVYAGYRLLQAAQLRGPEHFSIHPRCKRLIDDLSRFDGREASEHKHSIDALRYTLELVTRRLYAPALLRIG